LADPCRKGFNLFSAACEFPGRCSTPSPVFPKEEDHVHIRVMVTRGLKSTPYQNPKATVGDPTIVIVPEYKQANPTDQGIWLFTCHVRRSSLDVQDPMLNTHSKHNCIAACIQVGSSPIEAAVQLPSRLLGIALG